MEAFQQAISLPISYRFSSASPSSRSIRSSGVWMDGRIWSKLPQSLVERVIAFLPPPAFCRARCVCKRWYSLLFSNTFLDLYLQVSPRRHWFLFFKHKTLNNCIYTTSDVSEGYLLDPEDMAWYRLSFPLLPSGFSPASSSGGLICWASHEAGPKCLILCNPILGSLTQLPPTHRPRLYPSVGLSVGPTSLHITVAGDDMISPYAVKNLTAESLHVDGGGFYSVWETSSSLPRLCSLESGRMVEVEGRLYSMNFSPFSVLAYDVAANSWWKIQAPMRRFLRSPSLFESRGRLLLAAAVEKSKLNVPKSFRLWGLQPCGTAWVEMERMPQQLYLQFTDLERGAGFHCIGHGDFLVISIPATHRALLFHMVAKIWRWIPPCPYLHAHAGELLHGFAYQPRLATPVSRLLDQLTLPFHTFPN